ncbi:MAG: 50S ribosomal protein L4 [Clostridia bacterium]|nr:50S ribosomal protein L4 [Clostridia bacterium]MBQ3076947.1 50S ribosomal protein L4 [Clostridia bacterium]
MPKVSVMDMSGKITGELELSQRVFGAEINKAVLHQAVVAYLANQRQGNQSALTRAEVSGGGAKPWRQKGTGRARQGSTRAPQWTHGGIVFAPKPRSYRVSLNKKQRALAMRSALSSKVADGTIKVVDGEKFAEIKTKSAAAFLKAIGAEGKTLVVTGEVDKNLVLSARNIPGVITAPVNALSVYDILNCDNFVIMKDAVTKLEEVYA